MVQSGPRSTSHTIIFGDARSMHEIGDRSVHLIITSPPYWQLKDYDNRDQIGFDDSYESYINNLNLVWNECNRVLHPGCRLCINIGDQFARSVYYGRYKIIPIRTEIIRFCETIGLDYMGAIIWQKVTTCNTTGGGTVMGSFPYPRNGILKLDYEFILLFRKPGKPPIATAAMKERSALTTEEWNTYFQGHWNFSGEKQDRHLAAFPVELPRRLIRMFSFVGETVLDPFMGSGTTSVAAKELSRSSVGYEINRKNATVIAERMTGASCTFHNRDKTWAFDKSPALDALPYRFTDPVRLDRRTSAKERTFGSKIDARTPPREDHHRVKRVLSPRIVELDDGQRVRLLGVRPHSEHQKDAVAYLKDLLAGQKVYMRFDDIAHDSDNNRLCYLFLANRTFVNGRLIREGFAGVDDEFPLQKAAMFHRYLAQQDLS